MNQKSDLVDLMARQIGLLKGLAHHDWVARLEAAKDRIRDGRFNLLFVGDYCRGKSTLLNALMGEEVLAASIVPVPTVNCIERSDRPFAHVWAADGRKQSVSLSALQEANYSRVNVGYPLPWLPLDVTLIEQPTLEQTDAFTQAIAQADWVVMVLASDSLYSMAEQKAFEQIKAAGHRSLLFVCSCCDRIPVAERAKLKEAAYVRLPVNPDQIFFLSAEQVLRGDSQAIAEIEKFKEALLNGVTATGQAFKQERAQRLLQQSIVLAKTAIEKQQTTQAQKQIAGQTHRQKLQLIYEDTAAIGRELEAELSDFRQRTGAVIQAMTNTFVRNLAQETANWIDTSDTSLSQTAIERRIRSTVLRGQQTELEPYLQTQISHQAQDLQSQSQVFNRQLKNLYEQMGTAEPSTALSLKLKDVSLDEVSLGISELPLTSAEDEASDLFNPSRIVIPVAVAAAILLVVRPFFLAIPASLAGLGATTFFSMNRAQSRQSSSRRQLARAYEQAIRRQADPISLQILSAVNARLDELQKTVRSHISDCLKPVQQYLQESPANIAETKVANDQKHLQEIEQAFQKLFPMQ